MLSWKYLAAGSPATPSVTLVPCSVPFPQRMNMHKMLLPLWCSKSVLKMLKIRSFTSADLQIARVCPLCPGEVHKAGFPLLVLHCSARLGSRQRRISCGGSNTQDASWQTDLVVSLRECRCGSWNQAFCLQLKTKKFFYMTHNFTQSDSLQKAHSPPPS